MTGEGKSIRWVVVCSTLFLAYLAWGYMAGAYAEDAHAGAILVGGFGLAGISMLISAVYSFLATSLLELPNFIRVISWNSSNNPSLPMLFALLEVALILGGFGLQKLENRQSYSGGRRRR